MSQLNLYSANSYNGDLKSRFKKKILTVILTRYIAFWHSRFVNLWRKNEKSRKDLDITTRLDWFDLLAYIYKNHVPKDNACGSALIIKIQLWQCMTCGIVFKTRSGGLYWSAAFVWCDVLLWSQYPSEISTYYTAFWCLVLDAQWQREVRAPFVRLNWTD